MSTSWFFVCLSRIQTVPLSGNMKYFEGSLWNSCLSPFLQLFFFCRVLIFHVNSSNLKTFLDLFLRPLISWNRCFFVAWSRRRSNGWSLVAEKPGWKTINKYLVVNQHIINDEHCEGEVFVQKKVVDGCYCFWFDLNLFKTSTQNIAQLGSKNDGVLGGSS